MQVKYSGLTEQRRKKWGFNEAEKAGICRAGHWRERSYTEGGHPGIWVMNIVLVFY